MESKHLIDRVAPIILATCVLWSTSAAAGSHAGRSEIQGGSTTYARMSRQGPTIGNVYPGDYFYAAGKSSSQSGYTWGFVKSRQDKRGYTGCGWVDSSRLLVNRIPSADARATANQCGSRPLHEYREIITWCR